MRRPPLPLLTSTRPNRLRYSDVFLPFSSQPATLLPRPPRPCLPPAPAVHFQARRHKHQKRDATSATSRGVDTPPLPDYCPRLPFRFETGFALFAKRTPRPFPPPFLSPPSGSFSDPLSTHHQSRDKRAFVGGELIRGWTNGDDAVYASDHFICANDGVGAWSARPRGHAGYTHTAHK